MIMGLLLYLNTVHEHNHTRFSAVKSWDYIFDFTSELEVRICDYVIYYIIPTGTVQVSVQVL